MIKESLTEKIEYVVGTEDILGRIDEIKAWRAFDNRVIDFCDLLSKGLMEMNVIRNFPDLLTLAFWLRKSNLKKIREKYEGIEERLGVGLAFHIAPGNVALSFAYSLATGLLTGNANVIRMPSRKFEQAEIFCDVLRKAIITNQGIEERLCLIKYPHDKSITDALSAMCHMRIIWGGNETVNIIRQSPIPPRATEITFANRFSICIINSDIYLNEYNAKKTAHNFYIDTFLSDQNACSSPRIVFWFGKKIEKAKELFWESLYDELKDYEIAPVTTVDKLLNFCKYSAYNSSKMKMVHDCRIIRLEISKVGKEVIEHLGNSGFFYEISIKDLDEILPICTWELQTLSYIGFDETVLKNFVLDNSPEGIDRIVPVGRAMDFGLIWDGKDIVRQMTRQVSMQ